MFKIFLNTLNNAFHLTDTHVTVTQAYLFNQKILFEWDELIMPGTILVSAPLAAAQESMFSFFLEANSTQSSTFSIHPVEKIIYLHQRISWNISEEELSHFLEQFHAELQQGEEKCKTPPPSTPLPPMTHKKV